MRDVNHVRHADATETLCGQSVTGEPVKGRPVCAECVDALMICASRPAHVYVTQWKNDGEGGTWRRALAT